jgi:hypothetical protein
MTRALIGVLTALAVVAAAFLGLEFYVQRKAAGDVDAAFAQIRATGAKASHGKLSVDLWGRLITVDDIVTESVDQPALTIKIARFTAAGVKQPDPKRFSADRIEVSGIEVTGGSAGKPIAYRVPALEIADFAGPAGLLRPLDTTSPTDIYRIALEHFAAVTAGSITIPAATMTFSIPNAPGVVNTSYGNLVFRDVKDGRVASQTADRAGFSIAIDQNGKTETIGGEFSDMAVRDFDSAPLLALLTPGRPGGEAYARVYRQLSVGSYKATLPNDQRMTMDGVTIDDVGLRASKLPLSEFPKLMAAMPQPGVKPTPEQTRLVAETLAGLYEGVHIGKGEIRGLKIEMPDDSLNLRVFRFDLDNGKFGEVTLEGLDTQSAKGPIKFGRVAVKSLDAANLLRMTALLSDPGKPPSLDNYIGMLRLLEGAEISDFVAPYKSTGKPVAIEKLSFDWGEFVGPFPSKLRATLSVSGPIDASDEDMELLTDAGFDTAAVKLDLGATWAEESRTLVLEPATAELGRVLGVSVRATLGNVPRAAFSADPVQALATAMQVEAGSIEITCRDLGGIDLGVKQYATTLGLDPEAARRELINIVTAMGAMAAAGNPDAAVLADALARTIETPGGILTIKLTPRAPMPVLQLMAAIKADPVAALSRLRVEVATGR